MATNKNYKGRPKVKKSKIQLEDVAEILEPFSVEGHRFEPGAEVQSIPAIANFDFLARRKTIALKKDKG